MVVPEHVGRRLWRARRSGRRGGARKARRERRRITGSQLAHKLALSEQGEKACCETKAYERPFVCVAYALRARLRGVKARTCSCGESASASQ